MHDTPAAVCKKALGQPQLLEDNCLSASYRAEEMRELCSLAEQARGWQATVLLEAQPSSSAACYVRISSPTMRASWQILAAEPLPPFSTYNILPLVEQRLKPLTLRLVDQVSLR